MFWGTFAALNQLSIKRLYAYSAVVNVGYMLSAMADGSYESFASVCNYLLVYLVTSVALFVTVLAFRRAHDASKIKFLMEYRLYLNYGFSTSLVLALIFFSLAGIPPLSGFFIKFFLFRAMFVSDFLLASSFFLVIIMSVVSSFYYIRVVRFIFFNTARRPMLFLPVSFFAAFMLANSSVILLFYILFQPAVYATISVILNVLI